MEKSYYKSPIGNLRIICDKNELVSLTINSDKMTEHNDTDFIKNIKLQLDEYFAGKRHFFDLKVKPTGTAFQKKVWDELQKIPYGKTKSYGEIAKAIGNKRAQRAVGSACNKNPIIIVIPCHRVILKNGKPGGFAYGNSVKQKLLKTEHYDICTH